MIAGGKSYPATKNSGIGWIGEVPTHWEVSALRNRYEQCLGKMLDTKRGTGEHLMPYLRNVDVQWDRINLAELPQIDIRPEEVERYTLRPGDLLVCEGGEVGRSAIWMGEIEQCAFQKALHRLRPRQKGRDRPRFVLHALRLAVERGAFYDGHESTIGHLTGEKLRAHRFPFPPETEQRSIEVFLDHTNRRMQRYIRAKKKLIALLEEQKHAITHQAVTGQIDVRTRKPYPAYKDSSVAWLGTIPSHWDALPLKRAFSHMEYGISDSGNDQGTIAVLTMGDVRDGAVKVPSHGGVESVAASLQLQDKDLLFNRTNSAELVGKVGLFGPAERPATFASYLVRLRAKAENSPEFLNLLLNDVGFLAAARREAIPSLHQSNLNPTRYGRLRIPLPPEGEQRAIVKSVMRDTSSVDSLIRRTHREIDLIQEHRRRLIADVVTGKLDVPGAGAWPDELDTEADAQVESGLVNTTRASGRARLQHRRG